MYGASRAISKRVVFEIGSQFSKNRAKLKNKTQELSSHQKESLV